MENVTRPTPPDQSEGCFSCGGGKDQILVSKKLPNQALSVALCRECIDKPVQHTQPFESRNR
jgi:hypothetical protein